MTLNLTSQYYSSTRDFAVVTTDHADVAAIEQVFDAGLDRLRPPQPGPTGTNLVWSPGAEAPILALIDSARHSLLVENEEMDDPDVVEALEAAARRGVDVEVVMTYSSSWASAFDDLVDAGVRVGTYSSDASLYIHAKVIVADGTTAFVGSQNFSVSSLDYNRELGIITDDPALVGPVARPSRPTSPGPRRSASAASVVPRSAHRRRPLGLERRASCQASASPGERRVRRRLRRLRPLQPAGREGDGLGRGRHLQPRHRRSGYAVIHLWNTSRRRERSRSPSAEPPARPWPDLDGRPRIERQGAGTVRRRAGRSAGRRPSLRSRHLIARYSECIDSGDLEGLADLLANAGFGAAEGPLVHGRDTILKLYERTVRIYEDGTPRTKHLVTNLAVDVDPGDATAIGQVLLDRPAGHLGTGSRPDPVGPLSRSVLAHRRDLAIHRATDRHRPGRRREPPHAPGTLAAVRALKPDRHLVVQAFWRSFST